MNLNIREIRTKQDLANIWKRYIINRNVNICTHWVRYYLAHHCLYINGWEKKNATAHSLKHEPTHLNALIHFLILNCIVFDFESWNRFINSKPIRHPFPQRETLIMWYHIHCIRYCVIACRAANVTHRTAPNRKSEITAQLLTRN